MKVSLAATLRYTAILACAVPLCWITATDQRVGAVMDRLPVRWAGADARHAANDPAIAKPPISSQAGPEHVAGPTSSNASTLAAMPSHRPTEVHSQSLTTLDLPSDQHSQIEEISRQLRQLGASYLLLELWQQPNGQNYRFRCDVAGATAPLKCCFDVTRPTAVAAMQEVLQAVVRLGPTGASAEGGALAAHTAPWYRPGE